MQVDCLIVGGGFAGLQAAIQLGRYRHSVAVVDEGGGRSSLCGHYHNLIGWPDGISGPALRKAGRLQAERLGVQFVAATAVKAERDGGGFKLTTEGGGELSGRRLLLATGVKDRIPGFRELIPCLGNTVYICPDCDGYEVADRPVLVLGAGDAGANMALTLEYFTQELTYVNHELTPVSDGTQAKLAAKGIRYIGMRVSHALTHGERFQGVVLEDGTELRFERAFIAFGGNEVRSRLAEQLGAELMDNRHVVVDPRTKRTTVEHVWAAGDLAGHSEMVTIAMGDGSQAAIWMHKSLLGD